MEPKKTSWGEVAPWYDSLLEESEDTYQTKVLLPNLLRLLSPKKGMEVLDLACGQGFFSRAFMEAGATVTGVDISKELIEQARARSPGIQFLVAAAHKLTCAKETFDAITVILALQNIEDLSGTIRECSRVLRPNGRLCIVLNHPAFRIPKKSEWGFDEKKQLQYRRIDGYMSESQVEILMHPGKGGPTTLSFHRPLQIYFKALTKNGFAVTRLEEWISYRKSQEGPRRAAEDRARKEIPLFLFLEARRS